VERGAALKRATKDTARHNGTTTPLFKILGGYFVGNIKVHRAMQPTMSSYRLFFAWR
jgi:hypothetical protein